MKSTYSIIAIPTLIYLLVSLSINETKLPHDLGMNNSHYCVTNELHEELLNKDKSYRKRSEEIEDQFYARAQRPLKMALTPKTLPIVVHVIHENGVENISDAQVIRGIDFLNDAFANIGAYDPSTGEDTKLQFCLAKRDPNGNATSGINRVVSPLTDLNISQDASLKNLIRWDPFNYVNLWIVKEICSNSSGCGVAGYAYLPGAHGTDMDGAVMEARWVGTSPGNSGVIIHELGHYLGLFHTFQGGCTNSDCLIDGDRVCDTPPDQSTARVPCNASPNTCSTDVNTGDVNNPFTTDQNDMFWNYMDYGDWDCYSAFTLGQAERMHMAIEDVRFSLLSSLACQDPCTDLITASFVPSSTLVDIGSNVTFTNTTNNAISYNWYVNNVLESSSTDFDYTFPVKGIYKVTLEANNSDPNCLTTTTIEIEVRCPVTADYQVNSTIVKPSDAVLFTNTSTNANSYEWYVDNVMQSSSTNFDIVFNAIGNYDVWLVADNGICRDTSFVSIITVSNQGLAQTGLPVWPLLTDGGSSIQSIDWTNPLNPEIEIIPTTNPAANYGQTGAAFNDCGELVFFAVHTGGSDPNQLFIYAPDGQPLLTDLTSNGPGLNSVRGGNEIQVVRVPQKSNEWFIIYNEWSTDVGSPINNASYNAHRLLHSHVRLESNGALTILERDGVLADNNGQAQTYTDGKAVSRTVNGDVSKHYLYSCRRSLGQSSISVDRFIISDSGINFDKNTGNVPASWWSLTMAGSPIELSPTEETLAVMNRNQDRNRNDIFLFDTNAFDNVNYQSITAGDLILVADGTTNDISNELPYNGKVSDVARDNSLDLSFLQNFERKLSGVEFSPNGRFLYVTNGGFVAGGSSNLSYLAQIDLEKSPLEVRLQVQAPPFGQYNNITGAGCARSDQSCTDNYHPVVHIESCYDGNLYYQKGNENIIRVIPNPNNFMPQNLVPSEIDLSTSSEPNITTNGVTAFYPDQIDGYLYLNPEAQEISFVVNRFDCFDNCDSPYNIQLIENDSIVDIYEILSCPDTIVFCAKRNSRYDLMEPINQIRINNAIDSLRIQYVDNKDFFDFTNHPECLEICDNQIDDDGDGLIDCDDPDIQDSCCCHIVILDLDLGPDIYVCENGITVLEASNGFEQYKWHDASFGQSYTTWAPGKYWVDAFDGCEWQSDTIEIILEIQNSVDLGLDQSACPGEEIAITLSGFETYDWFPTQNVDCQDCPSVKIKADTTTSIIVVATNDLGCISLDTMILEIDPSIVLTLDTTICQGASVLYNGESFDSDTSFTYNLVSQGSCDSIVTVNVIALDTFYNVIDTSICLGDVLNVHGIDIQPNETTPVNLLSKSGCDSILIYNVLGLDTSYTEVDTSLCYGETIMINGEELSPNSSTFIRLSSSKNCDSIIQFNVVPIDTFFSVIDTAICDTETLNILGDTLESNTSTAFNLMSSLGCDSTILVNITTISNRSGSIDTLMCLGDSLVFQNEILNAAGSYSFNIPRQEGCDSVVNLSLEYYNEFSILLDQSISINEGDSIQLAPNISDTSSMKFNWSPSAYLSCSDCLSPFANPLETTTYTLTATDENGCIQSRNIAIEVKEICDIYIPNIFSPNSDQNNDVFTVFTCDKITTIESLLIYDRWGELIFENYNFPSNDPNEGWNGMFNGKILDSQVLTYVAQVKLISDENKVFAGDVTLIN